MSSLKQKSVQCYASIPESRYVRAPSAGPLPFRSRDAANRNRIQPLEHRVKWEDIDANPQVRHATETRSSPNKGNVKSWLDSTSPTSVIEQAQDEKDPPTPSPICSPSPSSPVLSPRPALATCKSEARSSEVEPAKVVRSDHDLASGSKIFGNVDARPDSPTGSAASFVSEGGLLALVASKLFSHKENSRPSSRYSRERSGPIDDKHVMEDRSRKPPVDKFYAEEPTQPEGAVANNPLRRTSSEAASELSFGSANDRTLSMEFDAILAAAVAAGVSNALDIEGRSATAESSAEREQLLGIQEDSFRNLYRADPNTGRAQRNEGTRGAELGSAALASTALAAAAARQGDNIGDADSGSTVGKPLSSRNSSRGSRRNESEQTNNVPVCPPSFSNSSSRGSMRASCPDEMLFHGSSAVSENAVDSDNRALVNDKSFGDSSRDSPSSSEGSSKENIAPNSSRHTLEKVRRDKILAQALAYQDAKNSKYSNRFKREEAKINAWENQQRIKATVNMKKFEMKLEEERAKALEKMQNEIALAHKRAEERKASAEAVRGTKAAKMVAVTDNIRKSGKVPGGCFRF